MPRYRGYRSNSYGRRYWRRTGWWRRYGRRYGRNFTTGRRRLTLRVPCEAQVQFTIAAGENWSTLGCIQPFLAFKTTAAGRGLGIAPLVASPLYRRYTELYDEVKVDNVYVSGSIIDGIGIGGIFSGLSFCSAWDRHIESGEVAPGGKPGITPKTIQYGSEAQSFLLTNNSKQLVHRWNRASDIQEKTTFHDCSVGVAPSGAQVSFYDESFFVYNESGEVSLSSNIGYVPGLWMAFYSPLVNSENIRTVNVTFKVIYTVTFRNPKYGLSAETNAKGQVVEETLKKLDDDDVVELSKRLKEMMHEDVQLPLTEEDTRMSMEDGEKEEKEKKES